MLKRGVFVRSAGLAALGAVGAAAAPGAALPRIVDAHGALQSAESYPDLKFLGGQKATPPVPFDSNHNYIMFAGERPILNLVVTIAIEDDLVAPDAMSMQLNCYSPAGADCVYQQYVTGMSSLAKSKTLLVGSSIENFPSDAYRKQLHASIGFHKRGDLFNQHFHFGAFDVPSGRIPAGWSLKWELFHDASGNITGARYSVTTADGKVESSGRRMISTFKLHGTNTPVPSAVYAPIYAFEMNMVGTNGGQFKKINSGSGTITYESTTQISPEGTNPGGLAVGNTHTAETSNIRYAELGIAASTKIVQKFRAVRT